MQFHLFFRKELKIKMNTKILLTAIAGAVLLTGCANFGLGSTDEATTAQAGETYEQFIKNPPSFEAVKFDNLPGGTELSSAVAMYSQNSYNALKQLDAAIQKNPEGYKLFNQMEALTEEGKTEELAALKKQVNEDAALKKAFEGFKADSEQVAAEQAKQSDAVIEAGKGLLKLFVAQKAKVLGAASLLDAPALATAFTTATEQANYAVNCANYFKKFNATMSNAMADQGK